MTSDNSVSQAPTEITLIYCAFTPNNPPQSHQLYEERGGEVSPSVEPETPGLALESGELDMVGRRLGHPAGRPRLDAQQLAHPPHHRQLCGQQSEESGLDWSRGGEGGG